MHNIFQKVNVTKRSQLLRVYFEYQKDMPGVSLACLLKYIILFSFILFSYHLIVCPITSPGCKQFLPNQAPPPPGTALKHQRFPILIVTVPPASCTSDSTAKSRAVTPAQISSCGRRCMGKFKAAGHSS
ncbi:MAG: hypothetical protein ACLUN9_16750 [Enterocloster aldenensis]